MFRKRLLSSGGQAMVTAIVVALGVSTVVGVLLSQSGATDKLLRGPRIRSAMMGAHQRLKLISFTPSYFVCPLKPAAAFRPSDCRLIDIPAGELNQYMPQAPCKDSGPCGVEIKNLKLVNSQIQADILYTGTDLNFTPTHVQIPVPPEILQASQNDCFTIDPSRPLFAGFLPDGTPDCRALKGNCSGVGQYVLSVDPKTLKVTCGNFQTNVGCGPEQYMTSLKWSGKAFSVTCADRISPFTKFSFTPVAVAGAAPITKAPGPAPKYSCAPAVPPPAPLPVLASAPVAPSTSPTPSPTPTLAASPAPSPSLASSAIAPFSGRDDIDCPPPTEGGVWMCNHPADDIDYVNNACDLSKTGGHCCPVWAPIPDYMFGKGGVKPGGPGVEEIHLKCASIQYCKDYSNRCVLRF